MELQFYFDAYDEISFFENEDQVKLIVNDTSLFASMNPYTDLPKEID